MTHASVIVVSTYYRPVLGGAEAAAERLAGFLHRRGHEVLVLTKRTSTDAAETELLEGVPVRRIGPVGERSGRGKWEWLPALLRALVRNRRQYQVVCCVDYRGIGLAALAARVVTNKPVIFQAQTEGVISGERVRERLAGLGVAKEGFHANAATWPVRAAYGRADAIACISRGIERETIAAGVPRDRVHYLPNPVDIATFSPVDENERRRIRATLGVPGDATLGVFVGRLSREKGVMDLIRAWALARPAARLVIVGPAMTEHPWDVSTEARALVGREGLSETVIFTGGQPTPAVVSWLRAADFSIQPSHFEAMGLAAAEAMAAGLPVIATDTGGYRDFVLPGQTGLLVPVGDTQALANAVTRLVGDPSERRRMGAAARTAAEQFDERVILEQFAQLIDRLARR